MNLEDVNYKIWNSMRKSVWASVRESAWNSVRGSVYNSEVVSVAYFVRDSVKVGLQEPIRQERAGK